MTPRIGALTFPADLARLKRIDQRRQGATPAAAVARTCLVVTRSCLEYQRGSAPPPAID